MAKKKELTPEKKFQQAIVPQEEQPYPLPEGWQWVRLGCVIDLYNGDRGKNYPSKKDYVPDGIPFINAGAIQDNYLCENYFNYITIKKYEDLRAGKIQKNDILYCLRGSLGKCAIVDRDMTGAISSSLCIFRAKSILNVDYLFYLLQSDVIKRQQEETENGSAQPNLSAADVKRYWIPLPSVQEQERIVNCLEKWFVKINRVKNFLQKSIADSEKRKATILHKAFTGELTAKWRQKRQITLNSWKDKKISEVCNIVRGGSPRPAGSPDFYGGDIPFMKVADITRNASPFVTATESFIKEAGLKKTRIVEENTLLLTNSGATLGVPAICTFKTAFNDGIAAFLGLNQESIKFYYYFWSSKTNELRSINKGAAQPNLNTKIIGNIIHKVPTIEEQQEIVGILDNFFEKEKYVVDMAYCSLQDVEILKKLILEKAFRGGLSI